MTSTTPSGVESSKDEVYRLRIMDYVDIWSMWAELKKHCIRREFGRR